MRRRTALCASATLGWVSVVLGVAVLLAATTVAQTVPASRPGDPDQLRVVLLGTGVGPPVNLDQFGESTLIEAGGQRLLFDCGRGATLRLTQAGVPIPTVTKVFLTHLHSDHVVQLPDLFLTGWVGASAGVRGRTVPLEVWGPRGTVSMMRAMADAFAFDIHMRRDVDEKFSADGITVKSHDISEGIVYNERGLQVTAFLVDHAPIVPAFGYRIDYRGHSVVLSGDTRVSENLVRHAAGVDVLIHEAFDAETARAHSANLAVTETIIAHHTTPEDAGRIFSRVKPKLAVYSHAPATPAVIEQTRRTYAGPLRGAEDLLEISIGSEVVTRTLVQ